MRILEELQITLKELLVVLDDIIRACFRLSFKLYQYYFLYLLM
jgi:hypothetical protein